MTIRPEGDVASRIVELGSTAQRADNPAAWRAVLDELEDIAAHIRSMLELATSDSAASVAKFSTRRSLKERARLLAGRTRFALKSAGLSLGVGAVAQWTAVRVGLDPREIPVWSAFEEIFEELTVPALLGVYTFVTGILFPKRVWRYVEVILGILAVAIVLGGIGRTVNRQVGESVELRPPPTTMAAPEAPRTVTPSEPPMTTWWTRAGSILFVVGGAVLAAGILIFIGMLLIAFFGGLPDSSTFMDPWAEVDREERERMDFSNLGMPSMDLDDWIKEGGSVTFGFGDGPDPDRDAAWGEYFEAERAKREKKG